jgi:hypothetical protein
MVDNFGNFETICGIPLSGLDRIMSYKTTDEKVTCLRCRLLIAMEKRIQDQGKTEALQAALYPMKKLKNLATGMIHMAPGNSTFDEHGKWTLCGCHSFNLIHVKDKRVTCTKCLEKLRKDGIKDNTKFYVLLIWGDVEPFLKGPFLTEKLRDDESRRLKSKHGDKHGIYPMNVDENGVPKIGTYPNIFEED